MARIVGLLGATSFVGRFLVPRLEHDEWRVVPFSSRTSRALSVDEPIPCWVALCPLWAVPEHFERLEAHGVRRLVAVSSTSRFTKQGSSESEEREVAERLATAEQAVGDWAAARGITATILRPTMIYDGLHDRNIATIAAFIRRRGWFPILGAADGLRQPVHVDDVAAACAAALASEAPGPAYDLSGAETLSYRDMVGRVFAALGVNPLFVALPRWLIRIGVLVLRVLPDFRGLSVAMFDRMNDDMAFDHAAASRDLGFEPRPFTLPDGLLSSGIGPRHS